MASAKESGRQYDGTPGASVARKTLIVVGIVAVALFIWQIKSALLLGFAALLIAVIFGGTAETLRRLVPVSRPWALAGVGLGMVAAVGAFVLLFGPQIEREITELGLRLPERMIEIQDYILDQAWGRFLFGDPETGMAEDGEPRRPGIFDDVGVEGLLLQAGVTVIDALMTLFLVFFVAVFFAARPELYQKVVTILVPTEREARVQEVLETAGRALWQWLVAQLIAMTFVGISVWIGLLILGIPLAFALGLLAGILNFVPFIGPIVSTIPPILVALSLGTREALLAGLVVFVVQQIESYVIIPLAQQWRVSLPPAVVLLSIVGFGLLFGIAGVILATPLAVIVMVIVGMLYVQDVLGKDIPVPGQRPTRGAE